MRRESFEFGVEVLAGLVFVGCQFGEMIEAIALEELLENVRSSGAIGFGKDPLVFLANVASVSLVLRG